MHECILYKKEEKNVRCLACSHKCLITEGKTGICRVRKNIDGKLYLLVYGKPAAVHVDPIEKKPLYHFLSGSKAFSIGTLGCNFKCSFCQNFDISQEWNEISGENLSPEQTVEQAIKSGCKSIAYTYNEPAIFAEYVKDISVLAKKKGLKNVWVSNGYLSKECLEFMTKPEKLIDAINIDLKSFNEKFYNRLCKAKLQPVLKCIKEVHNAGIHLEITTLVIPKENDSEKEFEKIAEFIASIDKNIPWHISRFFPMYKIQDKEITSLEILKKAEKIGKEKGLKYVYLGNV